MQMTNGGLPSDQGAMPFCTFSSGKEVGNAVGHGQIEGDTCITIGEVSSQSWEIDDSSSPQTITVTFAGEEDRQTLVVFTCDPSADNPTFQVKGEIRTLAYELDVGTKYACAHHPPPPPPPSCVIAGMDYSALARSDRDYVVPSTSYQTYEFVFNVCRGLVWSDGKPQGSCPEGATMCERLTSTKTSTDVYGFLSTQKTFSNDDGPFFEYKGEGCLFDRDYVARVYPRCGVSPTPSLEVIHEDYYGCEVYVAITSLHACKPRPNATYYQCSYGQCIPAPHGTGMNRTTCEQACKPKPDVGYVCCGGAFACPGVTPGQHVCRPANATAGEQGVPLDACQLACQTHQD